MLDVARQNVAAAGFDGLITLAHVDAKDLPFADGEFAAVISNSILHHIPVPEECLAEMVRTLARGGLLFVRDLLRPATRDELDRLVLLYAADANPHQRQMFGDSLHAALTLDEVRSLAVKQGLPAGCVQQTSDRHWTLSWKADG